MGNAEKPLRRSRDKKIAGVCAGIAEKLELDPTFVRVIFVLFFLLGGGGFLAYLILWFVLPEEPIIYPLANSTDERDTVSESAQARPTPYQPGEENKASKNQYYIGIILIVAGLFFLAAVFIPGLRASDFWPLVLIALGVYLIMPSWSKTEKS